MKLHSHVQLHVIDVRMSRKTPDVQVVEAPPLVGQPSRVGLGDVELGGVNVHVSHFRLHPLDLAGHIVPRPLSHSQLLQL